MLASSNPSSELVQLGQSKTVCAVDHHHGSVGDINAHFHYWRGHQYVQFTVPKLAHDLLFFLGSHTPVQQTQR